MKINNIITNESHLDEISRGDYYKKATMQRGQAGMSAAFAASPEERAKHTATFQKRERGLNRLKARQDKERKAQQDQQLADLVAKLPELKAEYEAMRAEYKSLGGSDWQYADREQNLTDYERKARSMEGPMNNLWRQIQAAEKAQGQQGVAEGSTRAVDSKGRTQREWINQVRAKFPDAKIVQSKMIDGPVHAVLPNGKKASWSPAVTEAAPIPAAAPKAAAPGAAVAKPGAVKPAAPAAAPAQPAATAPAATQPAAPAAPADPVAAATQSTLDKLGARAGAAPGSNTQQVADAYEQKILDRLGKRFGLPPGSSMEQVQAAQQAHLDKNDPAAAAQYKQNMANIDADNSAANKPVTLAQPATQTPAAPAAAAAPASPSLGADFDAGLAAQKAGGSPVDIMLAQPAIAGNQKLVDAIGSAYGLPPGSTVEQVKAAAAGKGKPAAAPAQPAAPVAEAKKKEADYGDDYQDMVARVKKLAGLGPLKTVWDPAKRVYKNIPTAVQPKK